MILANSSTWLVRCGRLAPQQIKLSGNGAVNKFVNKYPLSESMLINKEAEQ
jgi:hypothetical protein